MAMTLTGCARLFGLDPPVFDDGLDDAGARIDGHSDARNDGANDGATGDVPPVAGCPQTYGTVLGTSSSRYRIVTNMAIAWENAQAQCLNDQLQGATKYTHLVVATDDIELAALAATVSNEIWTGLSDRAIEGAYQWVTQETNTYPPSSGDPWAAGEPKASAGDDCVMLQTQGVLKVTSCTFGKIFVCECDAFMNDPTKY